MTCRITSLSVSGADAPPPAGAGSCANARKDATARRPINERSGAALRDKANVSEPQFNSEDRDGLDSRPALGVVSVSSRRAAAGKSMIKSSLFAAPGRYLIFCNRPFFLEIIVENGQAKIAEPTSKRKQVGVPARTMVTGMPPESGRKTDGRYQ